MVGRQVRIFVPIEGTGDRWYENVLGSVIRPMVEKHGNQIWWFWFSRYAGNGSSEKRDCNFDELDERFRVGGLHRSVRFRYGIYWDNVERFEGEVSGLALREGYGFTDFRDYSFIDDLGGTRFVGSDVGETKRINRAMAVREMLCATSALTLDTLVCGVSGVWRFETNTDEENPNGLISDSVHHLVCNIMQPKLVVSIHRAEPNGELSLATAWNYQSDAIGEMIDACNVYF